MLYCCRLAIEGVQPSIPQNPVPDSLTRSGSDRKRKEARAPRPSVDVSTLEASEKNHTPSPRQIKPARGMLAYGGVRRGHSYIGG